MVLTRHQKKQLETVMTNDAAKTLVNMSTIPMNISRRNKCSSEEELKEAKAELRSLKLLKTYKSVQDSLKKTLLGTVKQLDEVNKEIDELVNELNYNF